MPTVTLKADDKLYAQINTMADELQLSRSEVIRQAVNVFADKLYREKVKNMLQRASARVSEAGGKDIEELDALIGDGLEDC